LAASAKKTWPASSAKTRGKHQRGDWQPALQRQPSERERQQQKPRIPATLMVASSRPTSPKAPRRRPSCTTCTPASSAGPATGSNANGVLAFVTNRSFIESRTFDGFPQDGGGSEYCRHLRGGPGWRRARQPEAERHQAQRVWHPDRRGHQLHGQARASPPRPSKANRPPACTTCAAPRWKRRRRKLGFIGQPPHARTWRFDEVQPDKAHNWVNLTQQRFRDT
jgi:hypothetical protein